MYLHMPWERHVIRMAGSLVRPFIPETSMTAEPLKDCMIRLKTSVLKRLLQMPDIKRRRLQSF